MAIKLRHIAIKPNYVSYCSSFVRFEGKHNFRKLAVLLLVNRLGSTTSSELFYTCIAGCTRLGQDSLACTYACIKVTLTRLVRYKYLSRRNSTYTLLVKGLRFIYLGTKLAPYYEALANLCDNKIALRQEHLSSKTKARSRPGNT